MARRQGLEPRFIGPEPIVLPLNAMQHISFYSWEADRPNNTNRGFIKTALEEAAALASDLTVEPRIDHDTQNVPGSPDIARTILKKIENSHVFVADVTIISDAAGERATPNPNVLIELGYAMHALSENRIILVMNEHFGPVEKLPFDLRRQHKERRSRCVHCPTTSASSS